MVVGAARENWREIDLLQESIEFQIDGKTVAQGRVLKTADQLVEHILWFANYMGSQGIALTAGQFITTGTWTGMPPLRAGQTATAYFSSLGTVQATLPKG